MALQRVRGNNQSLNCCRQIYARCWRSILREKGVKSLVDLRLLHAYACILALQSEGWRAFFFIDNRNPNADAACSGKFQSVIDDVGQNSLWRRGRSE